MIIQDGAQFYNESTREVVADYRNQFPNWKDNMYYALLAREQFKIDFPELVNELEF